MRSPVQLFSRASWHCVSSRTHSRRPWERSIGTTTGLFTPGLTRANAVESNKTNKRDLRATLTGVWPQANLRTAMIGENVLRHRVLRLATAALLIRSGASANPSATVRSQSVWLPLEFETNVGQFAPEVMYLARTSNLFVYLSHRGMTLGFTNAEQRDTSLRITLVGANPWSSI